MQANERPDIDALIARSAEALQRGNHLDGVTLASRAAASADALQDARRAAEAHAQLAMHRVRLGEFELAVLDARRSLQVFEGDGDRSAQSRVHSTLAFALHNAELPVEALAHAEAALGCARAAGDSRAEVWALTRLAMVSGTLSDEATARDCASRAIAMARQLGLAEELFAALHNRANTIERMGRDAAPELCIEPTRLRQGLTDSTEAVRLACQSGSLHREAVARSTAGALLARLHRHDEAQAHLERALELATQGGYRGPLAVTRVRWARLMEALGRHDEALAAYARVVEDPAADPESTLAAHRARYVAWRTAGRTEEALAEFERAHRLQVSLMDARTARRMRMLTNQADAERERDRAERAERDAELERRRADEARRLADRMESERDELEALVAQRTSELARARDDAEGANRAKTAFLRAVSHELRTPLNGVIGMTVLAQRRAGDAAQAEQLRKALAAAERLRELIDAVIDVTELESGRLAVQEEDFEPRRLVEQVVQTRRAAAAAKGLELDDMVAPNVPSWLHGDGVKIRKILFNYVDNAVKFSVHGAIAVRLFMADVDDGSLRLKLEVSDHGPGVNAQQRERIFDPFTQTDDSLTRVHGGVGLGLRLARGLARRLGGDAGVVSEFGQGATFWATVCVRRCPGVAGATGDGSTTAAEREIARRFAGARVLLADNSPFDQLVIAGLMSDLGLRVDVVEDGAACVRAVVAAPPALVLIALELPGMSGVDAARAIAQRIGQARPPVIALAPPAGTPATVAGSGTGIDDQVTKPVDWELLCTRLLHWFDVSAAHAGNALRK